MSVKFMTVERLASLAKAMRDKADKLNYSEDAKDRAQSLHDVADVIVAWCADVPAESFQLG